MQSKYFFFTLIILAFSFTSIQYASGQEYPIKYRGSDYENKDYGYGVNVITTGLPEWLVDGFRDGKAIYTPHKIHETDTYITYESASATFTVEKETCDVKLYNSGKVLPNKTPIINSLSHTVKEAISNSDEWEVSTINSLGCTVSYSINDDGINVIVTKSNDEMIFNTIYTTSLDKKTFEWTYELENLNKTNTKIGFTSSCIGSVCESLTMGNIELSNKTTLLKNQVKDVKLELTGKDHLLTLDTKDDLHDYLWAIKLENKTTILDFTNAKGTLKVGDRLVVDPVFGYVSTSIADDVDITRTGTAAATCDGATYAKGGGSAVQVQDNTVVGVACRVKLNEFSVSPIPSDAIVSQVNYRFDIVASSNPRVCNVNQVLHTYDANSAETLYNDILNTANGTSYNTSSTTCTSGVANNYVITLGGTAIDDMEDAITGDNIFDIGVVFTSMARDASTHSITITGNELEVTYTIPPPRLTASPIVNTVFLNFIPNGTEITGYRIDRATTNNAATCTNSVYTTIVSNTGNNETRYIDTAVSGGNCYSYQIYAYEGTALSPVSNTANATIFDIESSGTNLVEIGFERIDISSTQTRLNVTYTVPANLTCNFYYSLAGNNQSYYNIPSRIIDATHNESSFLFNNPTRDIITAQCDDVDSNATSTYVITQSSFQLQEQIQNFRDGDFGTAGKLGGLDLITLIVIIIAMVGLNRVNESVGGIFLVFVVGVMAYFEFVNWATFLSSAIAVGLLWTISTTRKN